MTLPVAPPVTLSMHTRDGVRLDADVYAPTTPGRYPVLLMRQPYGRRIASTVCYAHPSWYASHGYIVVIQDVRGRGTSEGMFRTLQDEAADGADTVAWAAALPGSNGAVGMYGFSYQGTDQLLAAGHAPPALRALAPAMIGWDLRRDWAYEGGAFCQQAGLGWAVQIAAESARLANDAAAYDALRAAAGALPFNEAVSARPTVIERYRALSHYHDWLDRADDDAYWRAISPCARATQIDVPALFVGGWYDTHLPGTLAGFHALRARSPARLVVGPWTHFPWGRRAGSLDFGADAIGHIDELQVRWFDRWLKDERNGADDAPSIRLFDMGARAWRDFDAWPREGGVWHLSGSGRAAIDETDGVLRDVSTGDAGAECLVHDPWRPVPSVGGAFGTPGGPVDRSAIDLRPDVLTFTSRPATAPRPLAGDVVATLHAESDAAEFDLACTLSRVTAHGAAYTLTEGYCRARRAGPVTVPMRATCLTLQPGEALRLSISGASFPAFPVNPGTGADPTRARRMDARVITLRIAHGSTITIGA